MRATVNIADSGAIMWMDIGFYIGIQDSMTAPTKVLKWDPGFFGQTNNFDGNS